MMTSNRRFAGLTAVAVVGLGAIGIIGYQTSHSSEPASQVGVVRAVDQDASSFEELVEFSDVIAVVRATDAQDRLLYELDPVGPEREVRQAMVARTFVVEDLIRSDNDQPEAVEIVVTDFDAPDHVDLDLRGEGIDFTQGIDTGRYLVGLVPIEDGTWRVVGSVLLDDQNRFTQVGGLGLLAGTDLASARERIEALPKPEPPRFDAAAMLTDSGTVRVTAKDINPDRVPSGVGAGLPLAAEAKAGQQLVPVVFCSADLWETSRFAACDPSSRILVPLAEDGTVAVELHVPPVISWADGAKAECVAPGTCVVAIEYRYNTDVPSAVISQ